MTNRLNGPVVVGIDGSADARRALGVAGRLAHVLAGELVIVHAVGLTEIVDGRPVPARGHSREIAAQFDEWCQLARDVGVERWTSRLHRGTPVDVILRTAREVGAELIVVGRRSTSQQPERLLDSTAHQIVERSRCAVLVVPPFGSSDRVEP